MGGIGEGQPAAPHPRLHLGASWGRPALGIGSGNRHWRPDEPLSSPISLLRHFSFLSPKFWLEFW